MNNARQRERSALFIKKFLMIQQLNNSTIQ